MKKKKVFSENSASGDAAGADSPEVERSERAVRGTAAAEGFKLLFGKRIAPGKQHDAPADSQIAEAQHIRATEGEDQQHLRGPDADPLELNQFLNDRRVIERGERGEVDRTGNRRFGDAAQVLHFAGGEAARAHRPGIGRENPLSGEFTDQRLQPSQNRLRRADGELLRNDAPNQSAEEVAIALEFRQSDLPDEFPEFRHLPAERPFFRFSNFEFHLSVTQKSECEKEKPFQERFFPSRALLFPNLFELFCFNR